MFLLAGGEEHDPDAGVSAVHVREKGQVEEDLARERIESMTGTENKSRMERVAGTGHEAVAESEERRAKRAAEDLIFMNLINRLDVQIAAVEDILEAQMGERFAENLAAKYLEPEFLHSLEGLSQEERRRAIAQELQRKIKAGEIDPNDPDLSDPSVRKWLNLHEERADAVQQRTQDAGQRLAQNDMEGTKKILGNDENTEDAARNLRKTASANQEQKDELKKVVVDRDTSEDSTLDNGFADMFAKNAAPETTKFETAAKPTTEHLETASTSAPKPETHTIV